MADKVSLDILGINHLLMKFVEFGGQMPFGASTAAVAEALVGLYFKPSDVQIGRNEETNQLFIVVFVEDGLHCTEDPDPDYELCHALGQTEQIDGLSPRNAGLQQGGGARTTVRGDALGELSHHIRFLLKCELSGWIHPQTPERIRF